MTDLKQQLYQIGRPDFEKRNGHKGIAIWLTGLSGSGKSTIANGLHKKLFDNGKVSFVLDGDNTRLGINSDLSFSDADRNENIRRVSEITKLFVENGQVVITAFISPFSSDRLQAKKCIGSDDFIEVFIDCPIEECEKRDVKGLYLKARNGEIKNFTGITSPFEAPKNADVHIPTNEMSISESVDYIFDHLINKI